VAVIRDARNKRDRDALSRLLEAEETPCHYSNRQNPHKASPGSKLCALCAHRVAGAVVDAVVSSARREPPKE
jgi:hypothetical protein